MICVGCSDAAKMVLREHFFDVLVLDVMLPKRLLEGGADPQNGIGLLSQLNRSSHLKRPHHIIGITSNIRDLEKYRAAFNDYCSVVIEASPATAGWREKVCNAIAAAGRSKAAQCVRDKGVTVLSVHGIRTYGQWQQRLMGIVNSRVSGVDFKIYKYGYFSAFGILIPSVRRAEVGRLIQRFRVILSDIAERRIVVFAHSFGTYLVADALRQVMTDRSVESFDVTVVLCGSVLDSDFDWSFLNGSGISIVNDCGSSDWVLYLSGAFAPGLGMAGKTGFFGFNSETFKNRFFNGGHSLYFSGDHMEKNWLPMILGTGAVRLTDCRAASGAAWQMLDSFFLGVARFRRFLLG